MPTMTVGTGRALIRGHYHEQVLATQPIAYWPLWESAGTVAQCLVNPAQNGTYSSDVSTWPTGPGIEDGNSAPYFDGVNDWINVLTAALDAAYNGSEGTLLQWVRVANAGVWADGLRRDSAFFFVAGTEYFKQGKNPVNNTWLDNYVAGGVAKFLQPGGLTATDWVLAAMTWSAAADEYRFYWNGVQTGPTQAGLGVWGAGALVVAAIGSTGGPANPWSGGLAHCAIFSRPLVAPEIAALAVI